MELLQAIGQMLDEKLGQKLDEKLGPINTRLDSLENRVLKIEITQENIIEKRLNLLSEGIMDINKKLDRMLPLESQVEDHEYRIHSLEQVVKTALP